MYGGGGSNVRSGAPTIEDPERQPPAGPTTHDLRASILEEVEGCEPQRLKQFRKHHYGHIMLELDLFGHEHLGSDMMHWRSEIREHLDTHNLGQSFNREELIELWYEVQGGRE